MRASWDRRPDEHVREYGHDYRERLQAAGFEVEVFAPADLVPDAADRERLGIAGERAGYVHFVTKPAAPG